MSRSTVLIKELFTGMHLVIIDEIKKHEADVFIRFTANGNKCFDKVYDYTSKEFFKMCGAAGTITDNSVIDDTKDIGKRLWICIKEVWQDEDTVNFYIFDTLLYQEGTTQPPEVDESLFCEKNYKWEILKAPINNLNEKAKLIAEQCEMIKKVESKKVDPDDFNIM